MSEFKELLAEQMKDEEFRKEYEALEPEFTIMQAMIDARNAEGMTQKELSERSGILPLRRFSGLPRQWVKDSG